MVKVKALAIMLLSLLAVGCGPDTIFLRPGLDTPAQHVANGQQLLQQGKVDDACREFIRAKELDPQFFGAYLGLGIALGQKGNIEAAFATMERAEQMAVNEEELAEVEKGFEQLNEIKSKRMDLKPQ
jgi:tetratricopeptide (TPR) repeat protein